MRPCITLCLLAIAGLCVAYGEPQYDKVRHDQIETCINSRTNHLLGASLDEVSNLLSLRQVPWDAGYTSYPLGEARIYHFRGFYLYVHLEILPQGTSPTNRNSFSFTEPELRKNGVRWIAAFRPFVRIDGITNPAVRMTNYWSEIHSGFRKRNEEMKKRGDAK